MLGVSGTELAIIVFFAFLLFGPDKLPQMGRTIGRALRQFRETQEKLTNVVQSEVVDPLTAAASSPHSQKTSTDADADLPAESIANKETFAERRARLAAEKAANKGEAGADQLTSAPAEEQAPAEEVHEEPADGKPSLNDLYARRPVKQPAGEQTPKDNETAEGGER